MPRLTLGIAACTVAALGLLAGPGPAAPALADKPPRWEYAELHQRSTARGFGAPARTTTSCTAFTRAG